MRGATIIKWCEKVYGIFQSTHPMRGATLPIFVERTGSIYFNPRTPCGVRRAEYVNFELSFAISIHAPHAGCDKGSKRLLCLVNKFQSTHPMRGATFPPRPDRRAAGISIHAPHAGCDRQFKIDVFGAKNFNPRTPCGVRHSGYITVQNRQIISIHAPHAGCDFAVSSQNFSQPNFNPRTPCGVRRRRA